MHKPALEKTFSIKNLIAMKSNKLYTILLLTCLLYLSTNFNSLALKSSFNFKADTGRYNYYYQKALQEIGLNNFDKALEACNNALKEDTTDGRIFVIRGLCYQNTGSFTKSLYDFNRAIDMDPDGNYPVLYQWRADTYIGLHKYMEALHDYNTAIRFNPTIAKWYSARAELKAKGFHDYKGALEDYNLCIQEDSSIADAYYRRGFLKLSIFKDFKGSIRDFDKTLYLEPDRPDAYLYRGYAKSILGDYLYAIQDYDKSIGLKETYESYNHRAALLLKFQEYKRALSDLEQCERLSPELRDSQYYLELGKVYFFLNRYSESVLAEDKSINIAENDEAYAVRGMSRIGLNQFEKAHSDFLKSLSLNSKNAMANEGIGVLYLTKKQNAKALEYLNKSIKSDSLYVSARFRKSLLLAAMGDTSVAISELTTLLTINPFFIEAYLERGFLKHDTMDIFQAKLIAPDLPNVYLIASEIAVSQKDLKKALIEINKAISLDSLIESGYRNRAVIKTMMNDYHGAYRDFSKAISLEPLNAENYFNRAFMIMEHMDLSFIEESIKDFDKAISIDPNYGNAYLGRSQARFKLGNKDGACEDAKVAVKMKVSNASKLEETYCK